ncbi:MAG: hypothetical protein ACXWF8_05300 [Methylobacter sp.]
MNASQDQSVQNSGQINSAQTEQATKANEEKIKLGVPTLSNCLHHLWQAAADNMSNDQLEFFSNLSEKAEQESRNLSDIVMDIGCLIAADKDAGNFQHRDSVSTLLFSLSHQLDAITAMMEVGHSADYRLRNPELYKPRRTERNPHETTVETTEASKQ